MEDSKGVWSDTSCTDQNRRKPLKTIKYILQPAWGYAYICIKD